MTVVAVVSDFRKARSSGFVGSTHRLGGRRFGCTRNDDLCAPVDLRALARPEGLGLLFEFCVDLPPPLPMPKPCAVVFTLFVLVVV